MMVTIPTVLMRGGSSKGLYFLASDLPWHTAERDRILLAAMGSPDARQIDGLGGGDDQTSKVMIVGPSRRPGIDVEYLFAQVSVVRNIVDITPTSGNMLSGVAPFAISRGLIRASDPRTVARILDLNTGKVVEAEVETPGGKVTYQGEFRLDGVPGTAAPIRLCFCNPAGGKTGRLLPTGRPVDVVDGVAVTCIDFVNPVLMFAASDVDKTGHESKQALDADRPWLDRIEALRQQSAVLMGMGDVSGSALPKVVMLAPPRNGGGIASRYLSPTSCHATHALTGAASVLAAVNVPGSVASRMAGELGDAGALVIEHPSGHMHVECELAGRDADGLPLIRSASVVTTARPLFTGNIFVRDTLAVTPA
ncbi:MAG: 4-oxalomesaconate tautomerase [Burkholderiales bacterium]